MWRTSAGTRFLQGAEARLFREVLGYVFYEIDVMCREAESAYEIGVSVFDRLQPSQQLALLAEVGHALLGSRVDPPELTSVREATVAAIYSQLDVCIEIEIDSRRAGDGDHSYWRALAREAYVEAFGEKDDDEYPIPRASSTDLNEWRMMVESLADRILWDRDWEMESEFVDAPPERALQLRSLLGVSDEYFRDIAPDPNESQIEFYRLRLTSLIQDDH